MRSFFCVGLVLGTFACSSSSVNDENGKGGGAGGSAGASTGGTSGSGGSGAGDASTGGSAGASAGGSGGAAGGDASAGENCVSQLVAGGYHTCARLSDKSVWCWSNDSQPPAKIFDDAVEIAAGIFHTCARTTAGDVWCWGANTAGQLGDGTQTQSLVPVDTGLDAAIQITAGGATSCARVPAGVFCWGDNGSGQAGTNDTITPLLKPTQATVIDLSTLNDIVAAGGSSCGRNVTILSCWGSNDDAALGIGSAGGNQLMPTAVAFPLGAGAVVRSSGRCAINDKGALWCWGLNSSGQVGDGTFVTAIAPVQVAALGTGVQSVSNTFAKTCASKDDGTAWCWGRNNKGSLGDGTQGGAQCLLGECKKDPVQVVGLDKVKSVVVGQEHACAAQTDGTVWCWGSVPLLGHGVTTGPACADVGKCEPTPVKTLIQCRP